MTTDKKKFTEAGTHLGFVDIPSGCVGIVDAIWLEQMPNASDDTYTLDVEADNAKVPVLGILSNGKRYLMLAIDDCVPRTTSATVEVEGEVAVIEETPEQEEENTHE